MSPRGERRLRRNMNNEGRGERGMGGGGEEGGLNMQELR